MSDVPGVLFLCVQRAGRSQMGAGLPAKHVGLGDPLDVTSHVVQ